MQPKAGMECAFHRKPVNRLTSIVQKLNKLRPKPSSAKCETKCGFLQDVVVSDGQVMSDLWETELTVLKVINPRCPQCLGEARELGDLLLDEYKVQLVAVMQDAPHLEAYLVGGLYGWSLITDVDNKISPLLGPQSHSTYMVAPGGDILTSFQGPPISITPFLTSASAP